MADLEGLRMVGGIVTLKEQLILKAQTGCRHFNGVQHGCCKAGVNYRELIGGPDIGWALKIPCHGKQIFSHAKEPIVPCDKFNSMGKEEAERYAELVINRHEITIGAMLAAQKHATSLGLKKGNGGRGEMPCPACKTGTLRYSVASVNGHMHAACSDQTCISWMQ